MSLFEFQKINSLDLIVNLDIKIFKFLKIILYI